MSCRLGRSCGSGVGWRGWRVWLIWNMRSFVVWKIWDLRFLRMILFYMWFVCFLGCSVKVFCFIIFFKVVIVIVSSLVMWLVRVGFLLCSICCGCGDWIFFWLMFFFWILVLIWKGSLRVGWVRWYWLLVLNVSNYR